MILCRWRSFSGDSDLHLKLDVPLSTPVLDKQGVAVEGVVSLHGNRFAIPAYNQNFSQLQGEVHFDQYGVDVEGARGEYRQQPLKLSAKTDEAKGLFALKPCNSRVSRGLFCLKTSRA